MSDDELKEAQNKTHEYKSLLTRKTMNYSYLDFVAIKFENSISYRATLGSGIEYPLKTYAYLKYKGFEHSEDYDVKVFLINVLKALRSNLLEGLSPYFKYLFKDDVLIYNATTFKDLENELIKGSFQLTETDKDLKELMRTKSMLNPMSLNIKII